MNQSFIHADIFFFITSVAVVLLVILMVVLLAYAVKIVRTVSFMTTTIKEESDNIVEDINALRQKLKEESVRVAATASANAPTFLRSIGRFFVSNIFGSAGKSRAEHSGTGAAPKSKSKVK